MESGADPEMTETLQEKLDKLVGAEEMKALCSDLKRIAPSLLAHNAAEIVRRRSYLFSVDPGCGYHTSLNLLPRTLRESGLMPDLDNIEEILYENAWAHAIRNIGNEATSDIVLTAEDFDAAAALADIPKEHNTDPIGFRT